MDDDTEHIENLQQVLQRLSEAGLHLTKRSAPLCFLRQSILGTSLMLKVFIQLKRKLGQLKILLSPKMLLNSVPS